MANIEQTQKAGDNSQQNQAVIQNINNENHYYFHEHEGITEEQAIAIYHKQSQLARKEYTDEANKIAEERFQKFENQLMKRFMLLENALSSFADPAFQILLRHAQLSAAATERDADYDLLTELLVCHVQKGQDRKNRAGISRVVEIVNEIDNAALCGLTVAHAIERFTPNTGNCIEGVKLLNGMFSKLMYQELPYGKEWLEHLELLNTIRLFPYGLGHLNKFDDIYSNSLDGFICVGIKRDSEEFQKTIVLLNESGIDPQFLVKNDFLEGYYRLELTNEKQIDTLEIVNEQKTFPLSPQQKNTIRQVLGMYSKDNSLINQAKNKFMEVWDSHEALHKLKSWWYNIPQPFTITQLGRVLAQINAKRCDPTLPDLI